jgi:hypothetical protein
LTATDRRDGLTLAVPAEWHRRGKGERAVLRRLIMLSTVAIAATFLSAAPADAAPSTFVVHPGESIQAALDAANPGDTVQVQRGTYVEAITIRKDNIHVVGDKALLVPPSEADDTGVFVGDVTFDNEGNPTINHIVTGVTVDGIKTKGFAFTGYFIFGAKGTKVSNTGSEKNGGYGFFANTSSQTTFTSDLAQGNGEAGFYIGDSPNAGAVLTNVTAIGNGDGIFVRNARGVTISGADAERNCIGLLVLAGAPGPAGRVTVTNSIFDRNYKACPASDDNPPTSGIGIAVAGGDHVSVSSSEINQNLATGQTIVSGGVVVASFGPTPHDNTISGNTILGNAPDIFWDGSGARNTFTNNNCETSQPPGLCSGGV